MIAAGHGMPRLEIRQYETPLDARRVRPVAIATKKVLICADFDIAQLIVRGNFRRAEQPEPVIMCTDAQFTNQALVSWNCPLNLFLGSVVMNPIMALLY